MPLVTETDEAVQPENQWGNNNSNRKTKQNKTRKEGRRKEGRKDRWMKATETALRSRCGLRLAGGPEWRGSLKPPARPFRPQCFLGRRLSAQPMNPG